MFSTGFLIGFVFRGSGFGGLGFKVLGLGVGVAAHVSQLRDWFL